MADDKESKGKSKTGENLLTMLGSIGSIAGPVLFGPDFKGDLGEPFRLGGAMMQQNRMEKSLIDVLQSNPHTQDIPDMVQGAIGAGGVTNMIGQGDEQLPTPAVNEPVDLQSDEFLQALSQARPDLAEKVLVSRAGSTPTAENPLLDMINMQLKQNQLASFQTPEEKAAAKIQHAKEVNKLFTERGRITREEAARLKREKWTVGEQKALTSSREATTNISFMIDQINSGIHPTLLSKVMSGSPVSARLGRIANLYSKEQLGQMRDLKKMIMKVVKTQSGVQYGFRELQWIKSALPSGWDHADMLKRGLGMLNNTTLWNKYDRIMYKADKSGNGQVAIREGMTPIQMKAYRIMLAQLQRRATNNKKEIEIFADPANAKLLKILNMRLLSSSDVAMKPKGN